MNFKAFYLAEEDSKKILDWLSKLKVVPNVRLKPQEIIDWLKSFKGSQHDFSNRTYNNFLDKIHSFRRSLNEDVVIAILEFASDLGIHQNILRFIPTIVLKDKVGQWILKYDVDTFEEFPNENKSEYLAKIVANGKTPELLKEFPIKSLTDSVARILINKRKREFLELFPEIIQTKYSN